MTATDTTLRMREFKLFQDLMYSHAGIRLSEKKHSLVQNRLRKRLQTLKLNSYGEYYEFINDKRNKDEFQNCINALTTNETFFFRHKNHWDYLAETIVPEWKRDYRPGQIFRAWSAASSTGEEPYSLGILLYDLIAGDSAGKKVEVLATDINHDVIAQAKRGEYGEYSLQKLTKLCLKKYFAASATPGSFRVIDKIRHIVDFKIHNLQQPLSNSQFDIVFLRNVMIYFDEKSKHKVMENITRVLKPGGYLFLGGAETISSLHNQYSYVRPTIYRKTSHE